MRQPLGGSGRPHTLGIGRVGVGHHIDESFVRRAAPIIEHVEQFGYHLGANFWQFSPSPCLSVLNERPGPKTFPRDPGSGPLILETPCSTIFQDAGGGALFTCISRTLSCDAHKNTRRSRNGQLDASVHAVG